MRVSIILYLMVNICAAKREIGALKYMSVPFIRMQNEGRVEHIINIEINDYPFRMDISIDDDQTYFLNLSQISQKKQKIDRVLSRKSPDDIFGLLQFTGVTRPDQRLQTTRWLWYNFLSSIKDHKTHYAWFNMKNIKQLPLNNRKSTLSEGTLNLGPSNFQNDIMIDLKRYSGYMKEYTVSLNIDQSTGNIFIGGFPVNKLENPFQYSIIKLQNQSNKFWELPIQSITVISPWGKEIQKTPILLETTTFEINLSSETVVLPKIAAKAIQKSLSNCQFKQLPETHYLYCSKLNQNYINKIQFQFIVRGSILPLNLSLKHLVKSQDKNSTIFDITWNEHDKFSIGQTLFKQYLVGMNYKRKQLYFGKLKQNWQTLYFYLSRTLQVLILSIFIISLVVVACKVNPGEQRRDSQNEKYSPRGSGYEMADVTDQSSVE